MESSISNSGQNAHHPSGEPCLDARPVLALWGPSQSGKSLLAAHAIQDGVLTFEGTPVPASPPASVTPPPELRFLELLPRTGSSESTALPTRFFAAPPDGPPETDASLPIRARLMSRVEWLQVLGLGFALECQRSIAPEWSEDALEDLVTSAEERYPAEGLPDPEWSQDLLETYAFIRALKPEAFPAKLEEVSRILTNATLNETGFLAVASALFWDQWESLTALFLKLEQFLRPSGVSPPDRHAVMPWAIVPLMLNARQDPRHDNPGARVYSQVDSSEFHVQAGESRLQVHYRPGEENLSPDLPLLQAATLELQIPVRLERVMPCWRIPLSQVDLLDLPGPYSGRSGGLWMDADTQEEQMQIVKRGKAVFRLCRAWRAGALNGLLILLRNDRYLSNSIRPVLERLLDSDPTGGVAGRTAVPLAVGLTGIDEEFANRDEYPEPEQYDDRLIRAREWLGPALLSRLQRSKNQSARVFPIRFPGTWDCSESRRLDTGQDKWAAAAAAFCASEEVRRCVSDPQRAWARAVEDSDGGLSSVAGCFFGGSNEPVDEGM